MKAEQGQRKKMLNSFRVDDKVICAELSAERKIPPLLLFELTWDRLESSYYALCWFTMTRDAVSLLISLLSRCENYRNDASKLSSFVVDDCQQLITMPNCMSRFCCHITMCHVDQKSLTLIDYETNCWTLVRLRSPLRHSSSVSLEVSLSGSEYGQKAFRLGIKKTWMTSCSCNNKRRRRCDEHWDRSA